jgi:hypothetical protein
VGVEDAPARLEQLILSDLLPDFCRESGMDPAGFKIEGRVFQPDVAARFLRSLDERAVERRAGAIFWLPRTKTPPSMFWHGAKSSVPRPILLSSETLLDVGAAGALQLDHGWPKDRLGFQSTGYEFDVVAYGDDDAVAIAVETKTHQAEAERLIEDVSFCGRSGSHELSACPSALDRRDGTNHHKKYAGLVSLGAPIFWVVGPARDRAFEVDHLDEGRLKLVEGSLDTLLARQ